MKKLLTISTACIVVCMLLSSCASNLSIVKRHYRPGYYIDYTKKAPSEYALKKTAHSEKITIAALPARKLPAIPLPEGNLNSNVSTSSGIVAVPTEEKTVPGHSFSFNVKQALINPFSIAKTATSTMQSKQQALYEGNAGYDDGGGRAALSLLWIVIVVILILWLIGVLSGNFGLGGLINLLLIIALILLILWLLRIA